MRTRLRAKRVWLSITDHYEPFWRNTDERVADESGVSQHRAKLLPMTYVQPVFAVLLVSVIFGILRSRARAGSSRFLLVSTLLLFLFCWTPISMLVIRAAQSPYSRTPPSHSDVQVIVVLAGLIQDPFPPAPMSIPSSGTYERCVYAAWLQKQRPALPVLVSGGGDPLPGAPSYSRVMRDILLREGVPPDMVWIEDRSRSTYENALFSAHLLRDRKITRLLLVTEALHMKRAERCFQKQGFRVAPAPCGFRHVYDFEPQDFLPSWRAILWNEELVHEWLGLAWYWLRERI